MLADRSYSGTSVSFQTRVKDLGLLFKFRLTTLVVISSVLGFLLAVDVIPWFDLFLLVLSGFLITGASNAFNQIIEKDLDAKMSRTSDRPVATGRMSVPSALSLAIGSGTIGIFTLWYFLNPLSGILGLMALVSYAFVYTPLKRVTPLAVFIGAFPGAIPPLLGWVAVTGDFGPEPGALFAMQFMWQFPHFWAIAWVSDEDYQKAGFRLLPSYDGKGRKSAFQILLYSMFLIPAGLLPWVFQVSGLWSAIFSVVAGLGCLYPAILLYRNKGMREAKMVMFASFAYLPLVQIAYVLDKV